MKAASRGRLSLYRGIMNKLIQCIITILLIASVLIVYVCVSVSANNLPEPEPTEYALAQIQMPELRLRPFMHKLTEGYDMAREYLISVIPPKPEKIELDVDKNQDILFVGNSLTEGMHYTVDSDNTFLSKNGISLDGLKLSAIRNMDFKVVIINMGTNELGHYSEERFKTSYQKLIDVILETNPEAYIMCCSVPPVAEQTDYSKEYNNENARLYSTYIQDICEANNLCYIDNSEFFGDILQDSWTGDGLHYYGKIYQEWYDFLLSKI